MPRRLISRFAVIAMCLTTAAITAGCGTGGDESGPGSLLLLRLVGTQYHIFERQLADGAERELLGASEPISGLRDPAISPDGDRIAYVHFPLRAATSGNASDVHGDLWVAGRDGSDARRIYEHERPNQIIGAPAWLDDDHLAVIVRDADDVTRAETYRYSLDRITLSDGTRETLVPGALTVGVSPDRDAIVYSTFVIGGEQLFRANIDGSDPQLLMDTSARLFLIRSPRFSPDGETVVFTAADATLAIRDERSVRRRGSAAPPTAPRRHGGIVSNVWTIDAAGGDPRLLAKIDDDDPSLTFGGDADALFVIGQHALYQIDVASGAITLVGAGTVPSELAWVAGD